jgi:hypothetical protein
MWKRQNIHIKFCYETLRDEIIWDIKLLPNKVNGRYFMPHITQGNFLTNCSRKILDHPA